MFTVEQSYYIAYNFLNQYWFLVDKFRKYDIKDFTLVTIMDMRPVSISDPRSLDPAKYFDWQNVIAISFPGKTNFTETEVFQATIKYLEFYQREFAFNLSEVLADLHSDTAQKIWAQAVRDTLQLIEDAK